MLVNFLPKNYIILYSKYNYKSFLFFNNLKLIFPFLIKKSSSNLKLFFDYNLNKSYINFLLFKKYKLYLNILFNIFYGSFKDYKFYLYFIDKNKDGYKLNVLDNFLSCKLGKSHEVFYNLNENIKIKLGRKKKSLLLTSNNLDLLTTISLELRNQRKPEPYKGKGVFFLFEKIKRKKIKKLRSMKNFKKKRKK